MAWLYLLAAGVFEVGFAISMKLMDGHRNVFWSVAFYICIFTSFGLLQEAMESIPVGTAYAVWTGIGGVGTAIIGMVFFGDVVSIMRIFFLAMLIGALFGLKLTSGH